MVIEINSNFLSNNYIAANSDNDYDNNNINDNNNDNACLFACIV